MWAGTLKYKLKNIYLQTIINIYTYSYIYTQHLFKRLLSVWSYLK